MYCKVDYCPKEYLFGGVVDFLIVAEVMALMIKFNKDIKGITIESHEFKLTQFADDTTLFLNGSIASLQPALNTLEIFGNFSGLKMNKEKTKMIWIGRKNFSKEKLQTPHKLNWGDTIFFNLRPRILRRHSKNTRVKL